MPRSLAIRTWLCLGVIYANFIAQVPYFLHVYYARSHSVPAFRPALEMGAVFALLVAGTALMIARRQAGWWLLVTFCTMDFAFYLWTILSSVVAGFGWFFQLANPDPLLRVVFAVGYLNFFAAGWLLVLLVRHRADYVAEEHA